MAELFEVVGSPSPRFASRYASVERFRTAPAGEVASDVVLTHRNVSPYCFDHDRRRLIFAELPVSTDLRAVPFVYRAQLTEVRRFIAVPYDELERLAAEVPEPERVVFVFIASRCGSTLLHQVFNQVDGVSSFSEPDVFTNLYEIHRQDAADDDELAELLGYCVKFFAAPVVGDTVAFKLKVPTILTARLYQRAFPTATMLFTYRNAVDWTSSWMNVVDRPRGLPATIERAEVVDNWFFIDPQTLATFDPILFADGPTTTRVSAWSMMWAEAVDGYLQACDDELPIAALRFEDLVNDRVGLLEGVFDAIAVSAEKRYAALAGFATDSHTGAAYTGGNTWRISPTQIAQLTDVLARHPRQLDPYMTLPNTIAGQP